MPGHAATLIKWQLSTEFNADSSKRATNQIVKVSRLWMAWTSIHLWWQVGFRSSEMVYSGGTERKKSGCLRIGK